MMKRILVVDDDLFIRELYEEILRDEGYEVDAAVNGEEGLRKILAGGYNLILLDVMMPKLDGLQVLDNLSKNTPQVKNGPIILLTNLGHDPVLNDVRSKGAVDYLVKADMTPDQLLVHLKKFLE